MEGPALDHLVCGEGRDAISLQVKGRGASSRAFDPAQDGCEPAKSEKLARMVMAGKASGWYGNAGVETQIVGTP